MNQLFQYGYGAEAIFQFKFEGERHLLLMKQVSDSVAQLTGVDEVNKTQKALTEDYSMTVFDVGLDDEGNAVLKQDPVPLSIGSFFVVRINDYTLSYKGKVVLKIEDSKTQVIRKIRSN